MGPPVGGLSGCRQGVFEPLAQGRHACVQKGGEKQPTRIDREMGITQKLVGKLISTLYLLSLSLSLILFGVWGPFVPVIQLRE